MTDHEKPTSRSNAAAREAWDRNASFWDECMDDGNDFVELLIWPPTERFLEIGVGDRILDVACGNGLSSRKLAGLGAKVVAIDFSEEMIDRARSRAEPGEGVEYIVLDATEEDALADLGRGSFQAVLCNMALFDMAEIAPLFRAVPSLLCRGGRFVFSVLHPCFNNPGVVQMGELEDRMGEFVTTHSVKISRYLTPFVQPGLAMSGQPMPHPYFHRSLADLIGEGLRAGLVLDALEERAFPPTYAGSSDALSWSGKFSEIPPILVCRMRPGKEDLNERDPGKTIGR